MTRKNANDFDFTESNEQRQQFLIFTIESYGNEFYQKSCKIPAGSCQDLAGYDELTEN